MKNDAIPSNQLPYPLLVRVSSSVDSGADASLPGLHLSLNVSLSPLLSPFLHFSCAISLG